MQSGNTKKSNEINEELQEICNEFIAKKSKQLLRLKRDWKTLQGDYKEELRYKTIHSEAELRAEMRNTKRRAESYGDKYEDFITSFSLEAKKIVKQGADYAFIKKILDIIDDAFNAIEDLAIDFSTSGTVSLELGNYEYEISEDIEMIKIWWENEYDSNPEVVEIEYKKQEEKRKREKEKAAIIERELKSLADNIDGYIKEWKEEIRAIDQNKIKELNDYKAKKQVDKQTKIEQKEEEKNNNIKDLNIEMEKLEQQNQSLNNQISSLVFLRFIKKEQLNRQIIENKQQIYKYKEKIEEFKDNYKKDLKKIEKDVDDNILKYKAKLDKLYLYPENPKNIVAEYTTNFSKEVFKMTNIQKENMEIMNKILEELERINEPVTISELLCNSAELSSMVNGSNQKLSALISLLRNDGKVERFEIGKKALFTINIENSSNKKELIDKEIKTSFAIDRNKIFNILKELHSKVTIKELKQSKLKDMTEMRINQIMKSLTDEKVIFKVVEGSTIYYKY